MESELKEYEEICPECCGKGEKINPMMIWRCEKCGGTGKIDWLEKMFGKKLNVLQEMNNAFMEGYKKYYGGK